MRHCDFRVNADFDRLVGLTNRPHRIRESTKRAGLTIVHRSKLSALTVAATAILQIGCIVAAAGAVSKSASISPELLTCSARFRTLSVNASSTWQEFTVNGTDTKFTGDCEVNISFTSRITEVSLVYADWQPTLLVKLYGMQVLPANSKCSFGNLTLSLISVLSPELQADLCDANAVSAFYIWVSQPVRVYLYAWPTSDIRASFSVAFVTVRAFDVCQTVINPSNMLRVDEESYVFASLSVFVGFLKNSTACSGSKQLRLAASSPFNALNVTVLAAPMNSSCWSLWLNELRISDAGAQSFIVGASVTLLYALNDSTSDCGRGKAEQGFTLKFSSVAAATMASTFATNTPAYAATSIMAVPLTLTTIAGSLELKGKSVALVIGSAVAATLAVTGAAVVAALLIFRWRRIRRTQNPSSRKMTSILALADADETRPVNHSNRPPPQRQDAALFSTGTVAQAPTIDRGGEDIVMADNDLYGTPLGS